MRRALLVLVIGFATAAQAETFSVLRSRMPRDEPGQLEINDHGFRYRSDSGKTILDLPFPDIREADLSDPNRIRIETYDRSKLRGGANIRYDFRLKKGSINDGLRTLVGNQVARPVIGSVPLDQQPAFVIPAFHRQLLGGAHGQLEFGPAGIRFVSKIAKESRTWLYRDIETIGSSDAFHFRLTTISETYTFDLKEKLPEEAYWQAWQAVYAAATARPPRAIASPAPKMLQRSRPWMD